MLRILAVLCVSSLLLGSPGARLSGRAHREQRALAAQASRGEPHRPPVDAPVIDRFRPPDAPWLPGNRGLEYDTEPGEPVHASSAGIVTFAGQVGGHLFVTIDHGSGLRTTVGFVEQVLVVNGDRVSTGMVIAVAGDTIHFTARRDGNYIDPESLFWKVRVVVRLVEGPG